MNLSAVISQLISLFLMMIIGYAAARTGLITPDFRKKLSAFTLGTAAPCIILSSALESSGGMNVPVTLGTAALFYVVMIALAKVFVLVMRTPASQRKLDELMLIYTNVGFMGIPVVQSIYGATGVAMVSMFILMFNLTFFSYGIMLISGGAKINLRAMLNPCIFAALGAMILSLTGLRLPGPIESTLASVGAINTPMAMMIIGASLAHSDLRAALTNMRSVGVMGDFRTYDYTLALRSVDTSDFMTATWTRIPYEVLDKVSVRIINEVKGINRIVYDITSKPPATIEWE